MITRLQYQQSAIGENLSSPLLAGLHISVNSCLVSSLLEHARELWWLVEPGDMWHRGYVKSSKWSLDYKVVSSGFLQSGGVAGFICLHGSSYSNAAVWLVQVVPCCVELFSRTLVSTYQQHAVSSPDRIKAATIIENMYFWKEKNLRLQKCLLI